MLGSVSEFVTPADVLEEKKEQDRVDGMLCVIFFLNSQGCGPRTTS